MSQKKIAFITGANKGIGFETAKQLAQKGIYPVIGSRKADAGKEAVKKLAALGLEAESIVFDVTNKDHHQTAVKFFQDKFGKLDILINNAGVLLEGDPASGSPLPTVNVQEKVLRDTFEANFFAVVFTTQAFLPLLKKSDSGRIVNVSSILGSLNFHADPNSPIYHSKLFAYNSSKTAVNAFTVHLAYDLKDTKIKVNSIHPGWVQTELGGSSAPMSIEDGAKTSVELALIPDNGPTGGYFHMGQTLPW